MPDGSRRGANRGRRLLLPPGAQLPMMSTSGDAFMLEPAAHAEHPADRAGLAAGGGRACVLTTDSRQFYEASCEAGEVLYHLSRAPPPWVASAPLPAP
jgi:hypothetical protein